MDLAAFHRAFFVLDIGALTNGGSITTQVQESPDNSTWSNLTASHVSLTALTTASRLYTQEVRADQITKRYVRFNVAETGGQNVVVCCLAWGDEATHKPGSAQNAPAVSTQNVVA